jgi:hypothetical protein
MTCPVNEEGNISRWKNCGVPEILRASQTVEYFRLIGRFPCKIPLPGAARGSGDLSNIQGFAYLLLLEFKLLIPVRLNIQFFKRHLILPLDLVA